MAKKSNMTKAQKNKLRKWWLQNRAKKRWGDVPDEDFYGSLEFESGARVDYGIINDKVKGSGSLKGIKRSSEPVQRAIGEAKNKAGEAIRDIPESERKKMGLPPKDQMYKAFGISSERRQNLINNVKEYGGYKNKMEDGGNKDGGGNPYGNIPYGTAGNMAGSLVDQFANEPGEVNKGAEIGSSALKMAGSGAAVGTAITPGAGTLIGAGVGALAGGVKGLIGANKQEEKQEKLEQQREYAQKVQGFREQQASDARTNLNYTPVFEQGGFMDGQGMTSQEGDLLAQFEGPTHENGGIDIGVAEVEGGETELDPMDYVFSDDLKNPDTGNTFADDSKKIDKRYGKRGDSDPLVYRAKSKELKELMEAQEKKKDNDQQGRKMQEGGQKNNGEGNYTGFQEGFDFGNVMQYDPLAATAGQTLTTALSDTDIAETPRMEGSYAPEQASPRPYLRDVSEQFDETRTKIRRGARTPGQYMSGMLQASAEEAKARGDVMRQVDEQNRAVTQKANYWDYLTEKQNIQAEQQDRQRQLQAEARKRNMLRQGVSQLGTQAGQVVGDIRRQRAQQRYNQRYLDVLSGMYPDLELGEDFNWLMRTMDSENMPQEDVESIDEIGTGETKDLPDPFVMSNLA